MDFYTIANYYIKFRMKKLNFIDIAIMEILPIINLIWLYFLFVIKLILREDIRYVTINDKQLYIYHVTNNTTIEDNTMKYLWLWKYTGFDINTLSMFTNSNTNEVESNKYMIHFKYQYNEYILYIFPSGENSYYYLYDIKTDQKTDPRQILFNMIELDIDYIL